MCMQAHSGMVALFKAREDSHDTLVVPVCTHRQLGSLKVFCLPQGDQGLGPSHSYPSQVNSCLGGFLVVAAHTLALTHSHTHTHTHTYSHSVLATPSI